eukprot:8636077-Alexandrium_andersonii.AAC.1
MPSATSGTCIRPPMTQSKRLPRQLTCDMSCPRIFGSVYTGMCCLRPRSASLAVPRSTNCTLFSSKRIWKPEAGTESC